MNFSRTLGLAEAKASLSRTLSSGKFPHALLVHGPEGAGQAALLLDLADILLCETAGGTPKPCGKCRACLGRERNNLENLLFLLPLEKKGGGDGELESSQVDELGVKAGELREDPYGFISTEKSRIHIAQVRELQARLAYAQAGGRVRVIVILGAESMPQEAANALLKTLEEPPANVHFLLSCENRAALLPTILSRCTQLALPALESSELEAALAARPEWWDGRSPRKLIPFAEGSLGVLLNLHRHGGEPLLYEAGRFLATSLGGDWRTFAAYLEESPHFGDMEGGARLLHFVLRLIRGYHRLDVLEGPAAGGGSTWLAGALERQGWDADLCACLEPLTRVENLAAYAGFVEATLSAIQAYSKPQMATLGHYLEFEMKTGKD